jgi:3-hydroxy-5-methyl-1-naphthoate 3-O-methyltransferase
VLERQPQYFIISGNMRKRPLPRPPQELLDLATGYQRSKTLFALVEFDLPTLLARRSLPLEEIARQIQLHPIAADRFLNACVALGLLERVGGEYRNTPLSEAFLVRGGPTYLGDQVLNFDRTSYTLWAGLVSSLRAWRPGATNDETPQKSHQDRASMRAQHNFSLLVGHALGRTYDFSRHREMLDLGAGTGAMSIAICGLHEQLRAVVFDLPSISEIAREFVGAGPLSDRIEICHGNFKEDELPAGFDVVLLANLLSIASEDTNRELLIRLYELLPDGGSCIISGWILDDDRTSPLLPVLFCLEDINWGAPDVERSASTYQKWLGEAGFVEIRREVYCPPTSMIVGRKRSKSVIPGDEPDA